MVMEDRIAFVRRELEQLARTNPSLWVKERAFWPEENLHHHIFSITVTRAVDLVVKYGAEWLCDHGFATAAVVGKAAIAQAFDPNPWSMADLPPTPHIRDETLCAAATVSWILWLVWRKPNPPKNRPLSGISPKKERVVWIPCASLNRNI